MRKVMISKYRDSTDGWELKEIGEAVFHQFGVGYHEFENGVGNYSTAIVEWQDGTVSNVPVERVRFLSEE